MRATGAGIVALGAVSLVMVRYAASPPVGQGAVRSEQPITAEIRLGLPAGPVNRLILGSNVLWVDRGDALLSPDGSRFDEQMLDLVEALGTTVLRYPGGAFADTFSWRSGIGPLRTRGTSEHFFTRQHQQVLFGTAEFLELCRRLGAKPLITVNAAAGSPQEAGDWVRAVNHPFTGAGAGAGPVQYWEVGNEPYLKEDVRPEAAVEPRVFAARANAFIRAMREADDALTIGVPLRLDRLGALPGVAFPGFADTMLRTIVERFDFVALHNAYMPFVTDRVGRYSSEDLFRASMAAYQVVEEDLRQMRRLLDGFYPAWRIPLAITEYNAVYTLGGSFDDHIASLGGALYVADLLRVLATRDDILLANFWSLNGNWVFGAVSSQRQLRPAYHVLRAYSEILRGEWLELQVRGPTFDAPAIGAVPAARGVPTIAALATTDDGRTSVLVINKSATAPAVVMLQGGDRPIVSVTVRELGDARIFDASHEAGKLRWRDAAMIRERSFPMRLTVGAHSLLWVEIAAR